MAVWTILPAVSAEGFVGVTFNGHTFVADERVAVNSVGEATRLQDPEPQTRWGR